jgi:uncharacterized protein (TIGR03435 family)
MSVGPWVCPAQTVTHGFEVASIKANHTGSNSVSIGTSHGRLTGTNVTLLMLVEKGYQLQNFQIAGGPSWLTTDRYDVIAKTEDHRIKDDDLWLLLQPMLADRFKLKVRREIKQLPVYLMVVAGEHPKNLHVNSSGQEPFMHVRVYGPKATLEACNTPMAKLAERLSQYTPRKIQDKTGLDKGFDFRLEWARDLSGEGTFDTVRENLDLTGPSLFTALKEQLGLQLKPAKGPVETIVIESAEQPSAN